MVGLINVFRINGIATYAYTIIEVPIIQNNKKTNVTSLIDLAKFIGDRKILPHITICQSNTFVVFTRKTHKIPYYHHIPHRKVRIPSEYFACWYETRFSSYLISNKIQCYCYHWTSSNIENCTRMQCF